MSEPTPNTAENWDKTWERPQSFDNDLYRLAKAERMLQWQRMEKVISEHFGKIGGLQVAEVGAGTGTISALLAKRGAAVSIIDYAPQALVRSKEFFARHNLNAEFIQADALRLPEKIRNQFDLVMSFGLNEHFKGEARAQIFKAHFDLLKPGGLALISVPNAWNFPYRIYKFLAERSGKWGVGEEYPFTPKELEHLCRRIHIEDYQFKGSSFMTSAQFFLFRPLLSRIGFKKSNRPDINKIPKEVASPLDTYFSYALILCAVKP